ncbi:hypothetical protein [Hyalangium versicolor]|uniref:hypothetical protein n=1 Tax=Hyalangium versicolor TaxID=2861190 RepID=UPI001CCA846A|nr:hypothetical protein [Hyalangium versicolor]
MSSIRLRQGDEGPARIMGAARAEPELPQIVVEPWKHVIGSQVLSLSGGDDQILVGG